MNSVDLIRIGIDLIASVGFFWFAYKFYNLNSAALVSMKDAWGLLVLLSRYKTLEKPEELAARILKMTPEDAKLEIEKGRLLELISEKAVYILANLRATVPGSQAVIADLEQAR
jgi:hypothetical protein